MVKTKADLVAEQNGWTIAQACGYLDGQRDKARGATPRCHRLEMTDYGHGYWKAYGDAAKQSDGPIVWR